MVTHPSCFKLCVFGLKGRFYQPRPEVPTAPEAWVNADHIHRP